MEERIGLQEFCRKYKFTYPTLQLYISKNIIDGVLLPRNSYIIINEKTDKLIEHRGSYLPDGWVSINELKKKCDSMTYIEKFLSLVETKKSH